MHCVGKFPAKGLVDSVHTHFAGRLRWRLVEQGKALELDVSATCAQVVESRSIDPNSSDADFDDWAILEATNVIPSSIMSKVPPLPQSVFRRGFFKRHILSSNSVMKKLDVETKTAKKSKAPITINKKKINRKRPLTDVTSTTIIKKKDRFVVDISKASNHDIVRAIYSYFTPLKLDSTLRLFKKYRDQPDKLVKITREKFDVDPKTEGTILRCFWQKRKVVNKIVRECTVKSTPLPNNSSSDGGVKVKKRWICLCDKIYYSSAGIRTHIMKCECKAKKKIEALMWPTPIALQTKQKQSLNTALTQKLCTPVLPKHTLKLSDYCSFQNKRIDTHNPRQVIIPNRLN